MKQLFLKHRLLLPLLIPFTFLLSAKAQQDYLYAEKADSLFANLDKSLITTGILYDRTFPLSRFDLYNPATETVDYEYISQAYYELYQAAYNFNIIFGAGFVK